MPLLQIKNFFIIIDIIGHEVFNFVGLYLRELSKCGMLRFRGKGCAYLVLSLIIGNEPVMLDSMSR